MEMLKPGNIPGGSTTEKSEAMPKVAPSMQEGMDAEQGATQPEQAEPQEKNEDNGIKSVLEGQNAIGEALRQLLEMQSRPRVRTPERDPKTGEILRIVDSVEEQPQTIQ